MRAVQLCKPPDRDNVVALQPRRHLAAEVYTAKVVAALIDQVRRGALGRDETAVFVHSGGLPITFAYSEEILSAVC